MKRIGVLTCGGDAPGLNAAIKSVVYRANDFDLETIGILDGWQGLLDGYSDQVMKLDYLTVRPWDRDGGTHLGSSRMNPFEVRYGDQTVDRSSEIVKNLERLDLDGVIAMGGEGTLSLTHAVAGLGVPVVGVPKTIDKDVLGTDYTLGFATAVSTCQEIIERCRTPADSHHWVQVVETMGRHAGHLAFWSGIGGGAYMILVPEHPFRMEDVQELLSHRMARAKEDRRYPKYAVVVVAEGAEDDQGRMAADPTNLDASGHVKLGGIGEEIATWIRENTPWESRCAVPAHSQRGGSPGTVDRIMGTLFGSAAVDLLVAGRTDRMVVSRGVAPACRITSEPLSRATEGINLLDADLLYDRERLNVDRGFFEAVLAAEDAG